LGHIIPDSNTENNQHNNDMTEDEARSSDATVVVENILDCRRYRFGLQKISLSGYEADGASDLQISLVVLRHVTARIKHQ
jgi:hypothetical protein